MRYLLLGIMNLIILNILCADTVEKTLEYYEKPIGHFVPVKYIVMCNPRSNCLDQSIKLPDNIDLRTLTVTFIAKSYSEDYQYLYKAGECTPNKENTIKEKIGISLISYANNNQKIECGYLRRLLDTSNVDDSQLFLTEYLIKSSNFSNYSSNSFSSTPNVYVVRNGEIDVSYSATSGFSLKNGDGLELEKGKDYEFAHQSIRLLSKSYNSKSEREEETGLKKIMNSCNINCFNLTVKIAFRTIDDKSFFQTVDLIGPHSEPQNIRRVFTVDAIKHLLPFKDDITDVLTTKLNSLPIKSVIRLKSKYKIVLGDMPNYNYTYIDGAMVYKYAQQSNGREQYIPKLIKE